MVGLRLDSCGLLVWLACGNIWVSGVVAVAFRGLMVVLLLFANLIVLVFVWGGLFAGCLRWLLWCVVNSADL